MQVIRRNIEYNQIKNIDCLEIAIGDTCGKVLFDVGPDTGWGRISGKGKLEVECRTLDSLMDSLPAPQVVKIDVEGAEDAAIRGGMNLKTGAPCLVYRDTRRQKISGMLSLAEQPEL